MTLPAMTVGGLIAGLAVALLTGAVSRVTILREDASLAAFYLISLALGVLLVSSSAAPITTRRVSDAPSGQASRKRSGWS